MCLFFLHIFLGMMDIALITANANQLRYILEFTSGTSTYYVNIVLIVISLILQVVVGICLIFKGRFDLKGEEKYHSARRMNNIVVVGVFMVTIINVFIASFTITTNSASNIPDVPNGVASRFGDTNAMNRTAESFQIEDLRKT